MAASTLHVATRKGLFLLERKTKGWRVASQHFLGVPVTAVLHDARDDTIYAALDHGHFGVKLHRSSDRGATFEEIAAPKYPEQPKGVTDLEPFRQIPIPWHLKLIWTLEAGGESEPGVLWCGTIPGGLFRSADRGASWTLVRSLWDSPARKRWAGGGYDFPGIHSILVDPRDPQDLVIGVSVGGVWGTSDGGQTWTPRSEGMFGDHVPPELAREITVQDPHRVAQCRAEPDVLWSQNHNTVFRSTDRGRTWHEVQSAVSQFGFPVAVHPRDPETAWLVPAVKDACRIPVDGALVVNRTTNGGRTWKTMTNGLPQKHCYDLVYRHGLAVDAKGKQLALGSTSGGVWVSADKGRTWQAPPARLPPVYALRFAD